MTSTSDAVNSEARAFIEWAREHAITLSIPRQDDDYDDLQALLPMVGEHRMVAVGESAHYLHEWNRWRARLFKYLALEHGFTTFVLESALVEGRLVHEYVAGADHHPDDVAAAINNVWGVWGEINELIRWMRDWNADPDRPYPLVFYGMDGTGSWAHARYAYRAVHDFASRVDQALADDIQRDFEQPSQDITFANRSQVSRSAFQTLIGSAGLLVSRLQQMRLTYAESCTSDDYDWALRSAQILRDVYLALAQTDADFDIGFRQYWNVRDVSMTESLQWIRDREGATAGMVIGAHNTHLQRHPVRAQRATSMGSYFSDQFGREDMLLIGATSERSLKGEPPIPESNQAVYAQIGPDCCLLDLRTVRSDSAAAVWLDVERPDRSNLRYQPVCAGRAWDCLLFHRTLSTATVERPAFLQSPRGEPDSDLHRYEGRYIIYGFLAAVNTLDVYCEAGALCTDGQDDTSGEVFPPYRAEMHYCEDGRFRWTVWPSILEFHDTEGGIGVSVETPGGSVYHGQRVGDARPLQ